MNFIFCRKYMHMNDIEKDIHKRKNKKLNIKAKYIDKDLLLWIKLNGTFLSFDPVDKKSQYNVKIIWNGLKYSFKYELNSMYDSIEEINPNNRIIITIIS